MSVDVRWRLTLDQRQQIYSNATVHADRSAQKMSLQVLRTLSHVRVPVVQPLVLSQRVWDRRAAVTTLDRHDRAVNFRHLGMATVAQRPGMLVFWRTADRHAGLDGLGIRDDRFHLLKQRTGQRLWRIVGDALAGCLHLL